MATQRRAVSSMSVTGLGGEVLWLCPTLDDTGNGTTTLTNLGATGINNGLLSSSGLWVTDGNKRYIQVNASNNVNVAHNASFVLPNTYSFARWIYTSQWVSNAAINSRANNLPRVLSAGSSASGIFMSQSTQTTNFQSLGGFGSLALNEWHHVGFSLVNTSGSSFTSTPYTNGVAGNPVSFQGPLLATTAAFRIPGDLGSGLFLNHRFDDVRLFYREVTAAEFALLASERGYQPSNQVRRRRSRSGGGVL